MPKKGFWDLNSTTKIRLGAQMMRNLNAVPTKRAPKKKKKVITMLMEFII